MAQKIGTLTKTEGPYKKGQLVAVHPGPGTAGAKYVDELRYDAWDAAGLLVEVGAEGGVESAAADPPKAKKKGVKRGK